MGALSNAAKARLLSALEAGPLGPAALAFTEAVVAQRSYALVEPTPADASALAASAGEAVAAELRIADQVIELIGGATGQPDVAHGARVLANDPALLAAFFQNLDLLPVDRGASTDRVALLVAAALQALTEMDPGR